MNKENHSPMWTVNKIVEITNECGQDKKWLNKEFLEADKAVLKTRIDKGYLDILNANINKSNQDLPIVISKYELRDIFKEIKGGE